MGTWSPWAPLTECRTKATSSPLRPKFLKTPQSYPALKKPSHPWPECHGRLAITTPRNSRQWNGSAQIPAAIKQGQNGVTQSVWTSILFECSNREARQSDSAYKFSPASRMVDHRYSTELQISILHSTCQQWIPKVLTGL